METTVEKFPTSKDLLSALIDELKKRLMTYTNVAIFLNQNRNITFQGESLRLFNVSGTELSEDEEFDKTSFRQWKKSRIFLSITMKNNSASAPTFRFYQRYFLGYAELKQF